MQTKRRKALYFNSKHKTRRKYVSNNKRANKKVSVLLIADIRPDNVIAGSKTLAGLTEFCYYLRLKFIFKICSYIP